MGHSTLLNVGANSSFFNIPIEYWYPLFLECFWISSRFCLTMYQSWRWLGAESSWPSISDCKECGIRVNPKSTVRTRRRPPKLMSTPASPPHASPISSSTIWGWIWYPGDWVPFDKLVLHLSEIRVDLCNGGPNNVKVSIWRQSAQEMETPCALVCGSTLL